MCESHETVEGASSKGETLPLSIVEETLELRVGSDDPCYGTIGHFSVSGGHSVTIDTNSKGIGKKKIHRKVTYSKKNGPLSRDSTSV